MWVSKSKQYIIEGRDDENEGRRRQIKKKKQVSVGKRKAEIKTEPDSFSPFLFFFVCGHVFVCVCVLCLYFSRMVVSRQSM